MPPKQPKKGKGKKVTVTDPTSAPAPAPAAPPNPEVQAVLDAHTANVGSEHFPGGYFPIPYTLTSPDAESFPQLPPLREPLEAALFGKWDQPGNPHLVWRIDATRVNFALTRGVLSRFCCAVMGRYPTTLAVELKLSQVTLEAFNKTLKLCTAAASKEFVNCEGVGDLWATLQGEIQVIQGGPHGPPLVQLRLADKGTKFTEPHQRLVRYPDRFAPKAPRTLRSLVPAMAKNCAYYRDSRQDAQANVQLVITDLQSKDYCGRWWVPSLRGCLDKWGLPMPDLPSLHT